MMETTLRHDPALQEAFDANRRAITAAKLDETLDHFEAMHSGYIAYLASCGVDFRPVLARLIDAGAPIADWRLDPRVADVRWDGIEFRRVITNDLLGNIATDLYRGPQPDAFREVRNEYARRLTEWGFGGAKQPIGEDGYTLLSHLIKQAPSVEEFVDELGRADLEVAA